jgi:hypothetical protein
MICLYLKAKHYDIIFIRTQLLPSKSFPTRQPSWHLTLYRNPQKKHCMERVKNLHMNHIMSDRLILLSLGFCSLCLLLNCIFWCRVRLNAEAILASRHILRLPYAGSNVCLNAETALACDTLKPWKIKSTTDSAISQLHSSLPSPTSHPKNVI